MCLEYLYPYIKFALGTLYPAYKTWKSLKRKDETTRRRWLKYWVSFAAFQSIEFGADIILIFIIPFYYLFKLLIISWLVYGTRIIYDSIINRELTKREKAIDKQLNRIFKLRDEIIATIWCELSQCSVRVVAALMSGGLSVLTKSKPEFDVNKSICYETSPANAIEPPPTPTTNSISNRAIFNSTTFSRMLNYNNNEINHHYEENPNHHYYHHQQQQQPPQPPPPQQLKQRRSKRNLRIEEVPVSDDTKHRGLCTGEPMDICDEEVRPGENDITVEYIITEMD